MISPYVFSKVKTFQKVNMYLPPCRLTHGPRPHAGRCWPTLPGSGLWPLLIQVLAKSLGMLQRCDATKTQLLIVLVAGKYPLSTSSRPRWECSSPRPPWSVEPRQSRHLVAMGGRHPTPCSWSRPGVQRLCQCWIFTCKSAKNLWLSFHFSFHER